MRKRFNHIQKCKEVVWARWKKGHVITLREEHNIKTEDPMSLAKIGEIVIIHSDDRNKRKWTLGIITDVFLGPDGTVMASHIWKTQCSIYIHMT